MIMISTQSAVSHPLRFSFNHTAPTQTSTLSLHDALPILARRPDRRPTACGAPGRGSARQCKADHARRRCAAAVAGADRKSTRLNSSHEWISYAVFCLKKKKENTDGYLLDKL